MQRGVGGKGKDKRSYSSSSSETLEDNAQIRGRKSVEVDLRMEIQEEQPSIEGETEVHMMEDGQSAQEEDEIEMGGANCESIQDQTQNSTPGENPLL